MSDKLKKLLSSASIIAKERESEKLIPTLADLARELLEVDRCSLFLYDKIKDTLYTMVAHGGVRIEVPATAGIVGAAFVSGEPLLIPDAYADPRFNKEVDKTTGYRTRNILAVPLIDSKGKVMGVFQAINKLSGAFGQEDMEMLELLATYASNSLEAGMLYERIKSAYKETVMRLSHAAEYKDPDTYNHIVRIGLISSLMAQKLGFEEEYCYNLQLAAPMHDIGKIGIPDAILLKKGKLEGEEWEIMKRHTIIGYEILKDSENELLQMAARISLEHHEKWDGTGYPYGKKGKDICIEARITAIADVFDALTSERPYKPAWSVEQAQDYMLNLSGKHFDPELLKLFFDNLEEVMIIKREYSD
ncbi:MAG: HD domain-containing protein [Aquificaceae bacterium]|nr:HD domain-containing protein [Aquificaceae bacterium]MCX7989371.1 HD domain-containing protein [Aquificaceae bacterium]MDW8295056.1 HD domain-containing protein [Aquificaceae bacterium]